MIELVTCVDVVNVAGSEGLLGPYLGMNGVSLVKQTGREQYTSSSTGKLELIPRQLRVERSITGHKF